MSKRIDTVPHIYIAAWIAAYPSGSLAQSSSHFRALHHPNSPQICTVSGQIRHRHTSQKLDPPSPLPIPTVLAPDFTPHRCCTDVDCRWNMLPRRHVRSSMGFRGVRLRSSGLCAIEITSGGHRIWLGTFDSLYLAARAYYAAVWRFSRPKSELNFSDMTR